MRIPPLARVGLLLVALVVLLHFQIRFFRPYIHAHGKTLNGHYRLPDVLHEVFKDTPPAALQRAAERLISFCIFAFLLFFAFANVRVLLYGLILYFGISLLLGFFYAATILPDSKDGQCVYSGTLLETMRHRGSCNCLNVSGHLITVGLVFYLFSRATGHRFAPGFVAVYAALFVLICASRNHYTVDCLTSTVIVLLVITNADRLDDAIRFLTGTHLLRK